MLFMNPLSLRISTINAKTFREANQDPVPKLKDLCSRALSPAKSVAVQ